jgi:2-dehydropantoate 2-reductase
LNNLNILIAGAGSIGTTIGLMLSETNNVYLFRRSAPQRELKIRSSGVLETERIINTIDKNGLNTLSNIEICFLTNQSQHNEIILRQLKNSSCVGLNTIIVCSQNGINNESVVSSVFPENPILMASIWWSATLLSPNHVYYHRAAETVLGVMNLENSKYVGLVKNILESYFTVRIAENMKVETHLKLALNVVSPVLALVKKPYPQGLSDPTIRRIIRNMFLEACTLLTKLGYDIKDSRLIKFYETLIEGIDYSILKDHPHKVSTQISAEKYGGKESNVYALLGPWIEYARIIEVNLVWIPKILDLVMQLYIGYSSLEVKDLEKIIENLNNVPDTALFI